MNHVDVVPLGMHPTAQRRPVFSVHFVPSDEVFLPRGFSGAVVVVGLEWAESLREVSGVLAEWLVCYSSPQESGIFMPCAISTISNSQGMQILWTGNQSINLGRLAALSFGRLFTSLAQIRCRRRACSQVVLRQIRSHGTKQYKAYIRVKNKAVLRSPVPKSLHTLSKSIVDRELKLHVPRDTFM